MDITEEAMDWLEFCCIGEAEIRTMDADDIEGKGIITGTVGNEISANTANFLKNNIEGEEIGVVDEPEDGVLGSIAAPFTSEEKAERFEELIREDNGSLRLSYGDYDGWYCYEAE